VPDALRTGVGFVADAVLAAVLAPACAACRDILEHPAAGPVCAACWAAIAKPSSPWCRTCGDPLPSWRTISLAMERCAACRRAPHAVDTARFAGEYDGALRGIIHAFKYEGRRSLAVPLGRLLAEAGRDLLAGADCVVPVPLHAWRRVRRGFNQSADLAARLELPVVHALRRSTATRPQSGLTAAARRRNVRGAFGLAPLVPRAARGACLRDRVVVLVDDVKTTGATLDACARVLKSAGAREVRALTVAGAVAPGRHRTSARDSTAFSLPDRQGVSRVQP
jgi:ComF family protein